MANEQLSQDQKLPLLVLVQVYILVLVFFSSGTFLLLQYKVLCAQTDCSCNIISLSVTEATDGADAVRRISGWRRLSAAAFRDLRPLRCTGCQVTRPQRPGPPDLLRDAVPGGAGVGPREQRQDYSTYRQENTVEDQEGRLHLYCKRTE